jgi:hypothetical protein
VDHELGRMWVEAVAAYFKVINKHFPGRTEENHDLKQRWATC